MENKEIMENTSPRRIKTLANCTPREFAMQTAKISGIIKKYVSGIKTIKEATAEGESNIINIINYICGDNVDDTMEICGALLFMSGEKFANLDPEKDGIDGISEILVMTNSKRVTDFFISVVKLNSFTKALS